MPSSFPRDKRFWKATLVFAYLMFILYGADLAKAALLVFSAERAQGHVVARREAPGSSEIVYRFEWRGRSREESKLYRWPETWFLEETAEGAPMEILVSRWVPFFSTPRALILPEVVCAILWTALALGLVLTARRQTSRTAL